jgi:hypothetical protein
VIALVLLALPYDSIHPRFNTFNFAAQTSLRWYL